MLLLFKRLLTIWFLFFTLSSSVSWAVSSHVDADNGAGVHAAGNSGNLPDDAPLTWGDDGCQDRCCHASAHFIGLIASHTFFVALTVSDDIRFSEQPPLSFSLSPPFHPPIV